MQLLFISPILFPLLGLLINITLGRRMSEKLIGTVASTAVLASFAVSLYLFAMLAGLNEDARSAAGAVELAFPWIQVGALNVPFGFQIDELSTTMMLIVTPAESMF